MKKAIIIGIIIGLIISLGVLCIPKHNLPTDAEWEAYLKWEEEFLDYRNGPALEECIYQVQHKVTNEVVFHGTLEECKEFKNGNTDYTIMPYATR